MERKAVQVPEIKSTFLFVNHLRWGVALAWFRGLALGEVHDDTTFRDLGSAPDGAPRASEASMIVFFPSNFTQ
jgi:hypothetical protein